MGPGENLHVRLIRNRSSARDAIEVRFHMESAMAGFATLFKAVILRRDIAKVPGA